MRLSIAAAAVALLGSISAPRPVACRLPTLRPSPFGEAGPHPPQCPPPPPSWPLASAEPDRVSRSSDRSKARPPAGPCCVRGSAIFGLHGLWCWRGIVRPRSWIVRQRRQRVMKGHSRSRRAGQPDHRNLPPPPASPIAINLSGFGLDLLSKRMPQPRLGWENHAVIFD